MANKVAFRDLLVIDPFTRIARRFALCHAQDIEYALWHDGDRGIVTSGDVPCEAGILPSILSLGPHRR